MNTPSHKTTALGQKDHRPAAPDPSAPLWGHLQLLAKVGSGSFGQVFRAWDTVLHRQVALKLLPKGSPTDTLAEARTLAGIDHPAVIRVLGVDVCDGTPGLWMDFVEGVNLATRIRESGRLSLDETLSCGIQLAQALAAVHRAGLLHRDIKPANAMQRPDGSLVLMDLGTGRPRAQSSDRYGGTPHFTAPEVLDRGIESPQSDIYSLGAVLYNLVSGELPVTGSSLNDLQRAHVEGEMSDLKLHRSDLPRDFLDLVARSLSPQPDDRFESAEALAAALIKIDDRRRSSSRGRLAGAMVAVAALAAAALIGWQSLRTGPENTAPLDATISYVSYHDGVARTLGSGDTITPADRLGITLELFSPAYVYILNQDESGAVTIMFPLAGAHDPVHLDAHVRHYLPGVKSDQRLGWTFTSLAGEESFVVVASRDRLEEFEVQLASLPTVDIGGGLTVRPAGPLAVTSLMRGVSGLVGISLPSADESLPDLTSLINFSAAPENAHDTASLWVHEMKLHNEGF